MFLNYIKKLLINNVPIILEFNHLSGLLGFSSSTLADLSINTDNSYRVFQIPKKIEGFRKITSPYPALSYAQTWIYENILINIKESENSYAYCKGKNIVDNAKVHLHSDQLLKIDIVDFFGSIKRERIISVFKYLGYTNLLSFHLASICCYKKSLPQGACTSPVLSNIIAKRLDRRLNGLAKSLNLKYTRYADDITFSGRIIPNNLLVTITKILKEESFVVNTKKTMFKKKGQRKVVTGLLVSGDKVRVTKAYRREFRKNVHFLLKNKVKEFNGSSGLFDPLLVDKLIGKANFILLVEDTNKFAIYALSELKKLKYELS